MPARLDSSTGTSGWLGPWTTSLARRALRWKPSAFSASPARQKNVSVHHDTIRLENITNKNRPNICNKHQQGHVEERKCTKQTKHEKTQTQKKARRISTKKQQQQQHKTLHDTINILSQHIQHNHKSNISILTPPHPPRNLILILPCSLSNTARLLRLATATE